MAFDLSMLDIEPQFNDECNCGSVHHSTMVALGERLDSAMKARGVTVSRLAKAVDMSYQGIKKIVDGKTQEMDASNCIKIAAFLQINPEWLRTGEGQRELGAAPAVAERQISESQWALIEDFEMLPDDEKQALRTTLRAKADHVRKIVSEYLGRQGVKGTVSNARVAESFGAAPSPPPAPPTGPGSYKKITPIPGGTPEVQKHKEK